MERIVERGPRFRFLLTQRNVIGRTLMEPLMCILRTHFELHRRPRERRVGVALYPRGRAESASFVSVEWRAMRAEESKLLTANYAIAFVS